jgi:hypothetical protein
MLEQQAVALDAGRFCRRSGALAVRMWRLKWQRAHPPCLVLQVKQLCTANRSRPGCAACLPSFDAAKTYGSCDLLGTWGGICAAEPSESRGV